MQTIHSRMTPFAALKTFAAFKSFAAYAAAGLSASILLSCISDYKDDYKLRKVAVFSPPPTENTLAACTDKIDNNGNGLIDCDDPACSAFTQCQTINNADNAENTLVRCSDGIDNDGNGQTDCDDARCKAFTKCQPPISTEKVENTLALCSNKIDDDGNGKIDCADTACGAFTVCQHPVENTPALCQDGKDNDGDGLTDCKDSDCENFLVCHPAENTTLLCKDGLDNDGDGLIDCKDPDCKDLFVCSVPDQDTVLVLGYKTQGKLTPSIDATKAPWNLTWYYNGGDAGATDGTGIKNIAPGHSEEATTCNLEPKCRQLTFSATWGIAFLLFINNAGLQDTVNLSSWIGSALKFSIKSQVPDLRIKIESKHLADAVEIPLVDVGYDHAKTGWQNIVVPLLTWTSSQKMEFNRLPFSLTKPEGAAGGTVLLENLRFEKEGVR